MEFCPEECAPEWSDNEGACRRRNRASSATGKLANDRAQTDRKNAAFFMRGKRIESSHPAADVNASSQLTDASLGGKSWMASGLGKLLIP